MVKILEVSGQPNKQLESVNVSNNDVKPFRNEKRRENSKFKINAEKPNEI